MGSRGDQVCRVAVGEHGAGPQGERPAVVLQRQRHVRVRRHLAQVLLALLVLVGHLAVACLDAVLLHGERPVDLGG